MATRTGCACASTAAKAASNGRRKSRTISGSRRPERRASASRAAARAQGRKRRGSRAFRPAIPKDISKVSRALYAEIARAIRGTGDAIFPTLADGAQGVRFIEAAVRSSQAGGRWEALR